MQPARPETWARESELNPRQHDLTHMLAEQASRFWGERVKTAHLEAFNRRRCRHGKCFRFACAVVQTCSKEVP